MVGIKLLSGKNKSTRKYYQAEKWIPHQHWHDEKLVYDIGLVQVKKDIQLNERVKPIQFSPNKAEAGANARVTGWVASVSTIAHFKFQYYMHIFSNKPSEKRRCTPSHEFDYRFC